LELGEINADDLLQKIKTDILKVNGDFRQEEIIKIWEQTRCRTLGVRQRDASPTPSVGQEEWSRLVKFQVAKMRLSVSSGFYVRQFALDFGNVFGLPALTLSIVREKVGEWGIEECIL